MNIKFSRRFISSTALLFTAVGTFAACSNGSDVGDVDPTCKGPQCGGDAAVDAVADAGALSDASTSDSAEADAPAPGCVPSSQTDLPDDDYEDVNCDGVDGDASTAVFLSPEGDDSAAGTREAPLKTFAAALKRAANEKKDVYACIGTYADNVVLGPSHTASVFGGYDCKNNWQRGKEHALIAPTTGLPLYMESVSALYMEQVDFRAQVATLPSDSSVAAVIKKSLGVEFRRAIFTAGNGGDGKSGSVGTAFTVAAPDGQNAASAPETCSKSSPQGDCLMQAAGGGWGAASYICANAASGTTGGRGGGGGNVMIKTTAQDGGFGLPIGGNGGKVAGPNFAGLAGKPGAAGAHGVPGGNFGLFVDGKYDATNGGTDGSAGGFGLSGGGGSGGTGAWACPDVFTCYYRGGGGGQGGYGGCGGEPGSAGGGGGGSFALILVNSPVVLREVTLHTGTGGNGGPGAPGAQGQKGGVPGKGGAAPAGHSGYDGGAGGNGGPGGIGGPGGGGPSFGIVYVGTPHKIDAVTFEIGGAGQGGAALSGPSAPAGLSGFALELDASGLPKN